MLFTAILDAARAALSAQGISADANTIVSRVSANGGGDLLSNVIYGDIIPVVDPGQKQVRFVLIVTDRPAVATVEETVPAKIWIDRENTGIFEDTLQTVDVTCVVTTAGGEDTNKTYAVKNNGGASEATIRGKLGSSYANKSLAIRMTGPSTTGEINYWVTVTGTNGSTGTNVPNYDGTVNNSGSGTTGGGSGSNNGGSSSNNSGSSNTNNGTSQNLGNGGTGIVNGSNTDRNRFPYDVVLHIYQNNKVDEPVKNIVINDSLAADGTVSLSEVKTEVMKYFSAKTSAGIGYAGLYYARGNWVKDYATYNGEYDAITGIDSMRQVSQVDINVMITNATAKTTSTAKADSSNPKTGDTIFVPVMVMGLTASALAAAYVFGKKRIAR